MLNLKTQVREISYSDAEKETLISLLEHDDVMLMGQGINDEGVAMFGVTSGLAQRFGKERILDTPLAETGLTGVAIGTAMTGIKVLYMHNRPDFLMLALVLIINHASKYSYMSGGKISVPLVIWAVTGQGWGAAAQHSQSVQGIFMNAPGLKIVMPTSPYDAKGLLRSAMEEQGPVLFLEHRRLLNQKGMVPENDYSIPLGKGIVRKSGADVTIIAISAMIIDAMEAAKELEKDNISVEIVDLRTIKPYDKQLLKASVSKTKRVVIADTSWITGSVAKEISDYIYGEMFGLLKSKIEIVALPDVPTPASYVLEEAYYPNKDSISTAVRKVMEGKR